MLLKNFWYVAAWSQEIAKGQILSRTILGKPLALFRTDSGVAAAVEDRCPHRAAPMSLGAVRGETIECGYHGAVFDTTGKCVHVPTQPNTTSKMCINTYPIVERDGWLWVWMGNSKDADVETIPNWQWQGHPGWKETPGEAFHLKCNYQLVIDNLLDLSHVTFLHKSSIGTNYIVDFPIATKREGDTVIMSRLMPNVPPPPFHARLMDFGGNVDRWTTVSVSAPSYVLIDVGSRSIKGSSNNQAINFVAPHCVTPETDGSCFLFYRHYRNFMLDDEAMTKEVGDQHAAIYREDFEMIERQQEIIDLDPSRPLGAFAADSAVIMMRRIIKNIGDREARPV